MFLFLASWSIIPRNNLAIHFANQTLHKIYIMYCNEIDRKEHAKNFSFIDKMKVLWTVWWFYLTRSPSWLPLSMEDEFQFLWYVTESLLSLHVI